MLWGPPSASDGGGAHGVHLSHSDDDTLIIEANGC